MNYYRNHQLNTTRIKVVATALNKLNIKIVYLGGSTVSFYADKPILEVRPTEDVDVLIEILNYENRTQLEEKLRTIGFSHDFQSGIICRYKIRGIIVDILPTNDPSSGFSNSWYPEGFENSISYLIYDTLEINILSAPYFLATKFEAHKNRGQNDGRTSQDFEDIIFVLENRKSIWEELNNSKESVKNYLISEFNSLLNNTNHFEWIDCHVERGTPPATYFIIEQLKKFTTQ